jgi:hypothetical protein
MLCPAQLNKATIIHQWLPGSTVAVNATANGYRVLWSTDGVWYLDGLSTTWETMYVQEPCTGIPDNLCDTLVLGGGGEMWWVGGEMCLCIGHISLRFATTHSTQSMRLHLI